MKKLLIIVFLLYSFVLIGCVNQPNNEPISTECDYQQVERVVDGDTILLSNQSRVRLLGIDTPETVHPEKAVEFYGKEASDKLKEYVDGKTICLKRDENKTIDLDEYDRLLRYVWIDDILVNRELVKEGYAFVYRQTPFQYLNEFKKLERCK